MNKKKILELHTRERGKFIKRDIAAEQRRQKTYEEQDLRDRENLRSSAAGRMASVIGRDICDIEHQRLYGKRQQVNQNEPETAVAASCTPPEQLVRSNAVSKAKFLDDLDDLFGEEGTRAASWPSGEDELRKAVDEQFKQACSG